MTDKQWLVNELRHACDLAAVEAIRVSRTIDMGSYESMQLVGGLVFARVMETLSKEYGLPMPEKEEAVA